MATSQAGASLLLALGFIAGLGVIIVALLGYSTANVRAEANFRYQRNLRYAADQAIETAIDWAKDRPNVAVDATTADTCFTKVPSTVSGAPDIAVTCEVPPGSKSGLPNETGQVPKYAILALSQRERESPSYQGSSCASSSVGRQGWDPKIFGFYLYGSNRVERGIRFARSTKTTLNFELCQATTGNATQWTVKGKVFSDSPIVVDPGGSISLFDGTSSVSAMGGCLNITVGCTNVARTNADPLDPSANFASGGHDPATDACGASAQAQKDCDSWRMPSLSGLTRYSRGAVLAKAAGCSNGSIITFEPGWYDDVDALNTVFRNCKGSNFWFAPARGTDGSLLGTDYKQGLYYFDFTAGPGGTCNNGNPGSTNHQWCIGSASDSDQHVVGGTPYGWDPLATGPGASAGGTATTNMDTSAVISASGGWSNTGNTHKIDGSVARYTSIFNLLGRQVVLGNFTPQVSPGAYTGLVNVKVAHKENGSYSAPKIEVTYNSTASGSRTCGTFTLKRGDFSYPSNTPDELSLADQTTLGSCLNTGDKLNGVHIRYTVGGCSFLGFCLDTPPELDGITVVPGASGNGPTFPQPPGGRGTDDKGGDCDQTKPGVQFIFGGDSHLYVADGSVELCAGPDPEDPANRQQIAVRGVSATNVPGGTYANHPVVRATGWGSSNASVSNGANALRVAEPVNGDRGANSASISYSGSCSPRIGCSDTIAGNLRVDFPKYTPPPGTTVTGVRVRAAYDSGGNAITGLLGIATDPNLVLPSGCGNVGYTAGAKITPFAIGTVQQTKLRTDSCTINAVQANGGSSFTWQARTRVVCVLWVCVGGSSTDKLDGIELVMDLASTTPNASSGPTPVPNNGCLIAGPNYWNDSIPEPGTFGIDFSTPPNESDCALIKADQSTRNGQSVGRFSVKGTIYAPTDAIDIDDTDVLYPFFNRGLVARTLMFRGFKYRTGFNVPIADTPVIDRTVAPREAIFTACIRGSGRSTVTTKCDPAVDRIYARARVRFEQDKTPHPSDPTWNQKWSRVPKIQWWSADR